MYLSLNQEKVQNNDTVDVEFTSPSRPTLNFEKSLTDSGTGFFYFTMEVADSIQLIDETYSYFIKKDGETLKLGNVRFE